MKPPLPGSLGYSAKQWWEEQGRDMPTWDTEEWWAIYKEWIAFAFEDFKDVPEGDEG